MLPAAAGVGGAAGDAGVDGVEAGLDVLALTSAETVAHIAGLGGDDGGIVRTQAGRLGAGQGAGAHRGVDAGLEVSAAVGGRLIAAQVVAVAAVVQRRGQGVIAGGQILALLNGEAAVLGVAGLELDQGVIVSADAVGRGPVQGAGADLGVQTGVEGGLLGAQRAASAQPFRIHRAGGLAAEQVLENLAEHFLTSRRLGGRLAVWGLGGGGNRGEDDGAGREGGEGLDRCHGGLRRSSLLGFKNGD